MASVFLWWEDPNGVPLAAKASGITRDQLVTLAESITIDPTTHAAAISTPLPAGLQVVDQTPSVGVWQSGLSRTEVYGIDGASVAIGTRFDSSETAYSRYAANVTFLELADLGDTKAVWFSEGGNFHFFETGEGVTVYVEGAPTKEAAAQIAKDLR